MNPDTNRPELVLIAAVSDNLVIGKDLDLPWHIPEDLKRFKRLTLGYPMIMGRKTFDSLVHQFNGPLKNRTNVVISRSKKSYDAYDNVVVFPSIGEALKAFQEEERIFIGGGGSIYKQMLTQCDRWELTVVQGEYEGNAFFPEYRNLVGKEFELVVDEPHNGYSFKTYRKIRNDPGVA